MAALLPLTSQAVPTPRPAAGTRLLPDLHPTLATAALLALLALVPVLMAMALDTRTVNGIGVWIKPAKFLVSFVVYYATLAWVHALLPRAVQASRGGRAIVAVALGAGALEMLWLLAAAAAGVPSHFNRASPIWATAYSVAGVGAVALIAAILWQGLLVARLPRGALPPALRAAVVAGAVVAFGATLVTAGVLAAGDGHWVGGVPSDVAGLPLLGWSTTGGDLRVAHFFALHAQQALPLLGLALLATGRPGATRTVWIGAGAYLALVAFTFVQAQAGVPFIPWGR